jgi:hypothetical protein
VLGAMAALTGFVVTVTVLVVQTAIDTFSPRYMRLWYRERALWPCSSPRWRFRSRFCAASSRTSCRRSA